MSEENKIRDAADAIKGIAEAVPIYQDALQPAAKEVGTALQTIARTIHVVLAPVSALVWGYDQIKDFVNNRLAEKLQNTPSENITEPKPNIAGPALEALRYTGHEPSLRELYANLLATAMDSSTINDAHPCFVEIIRQLTPDEAKLLQYFAVTNLLPLVNLRWEYKEEKEGQQGGVTLYVHFSLFGQEAGCLLPDLMPSYLDNLSRLGLIDIPEDTFYTYPGVYDLLEQHPEVLELKLNIEAIDNRRFKVERNLVRVTALGKQFLRACVIEHGATASQ